jgi:hypothetical protein
MLIVYRFDFFKLKNNLPMFGENLVEKSNDLANASQN